MTWLVLLVATLLAAVAAVGVLRPFSQEARVRAEPPPDPLDEERRSLLRALRDLDEDRESGQLTEEAYRSLRVDTERRAVAVLRTIEATHGGADDGEVADGLRELRPRPRRDEPLEPDPGARRRTILWVLGGLALLAVAATILAGALRSRTAGEPITGNLPGPTSSVDPVAFFEQRVADHPTDVAARLDLAQRYLETGDPRSAIDQYEAALQLDPHNAEAHAKLGFLLFAGGRPNEALDAENQALGFDPGYPEALYYKGVILQEGLNRTAEAAEVYRQYLQAAPYGAFRDEVEQRLRDIESGS
jgi:tetratricopeptide (TPR) repeat protein